MIGVAGRSPIARSGVDGGSLRRQRSGHRRQAGHGLVLEHGPRRDRQPGAARPADQLDRQNAVAAEREEVVVDADVIEPERLGEQPAQHRLLRRYAAAVSVLAVITGAGSARRSSLPFGVSGSRSSSTKAAGTM